MEVRSGQKKMGQQDKKYVHMLNSTLCATTRTISCILENYQTPTGVTVPEVSEPCFLFFMCLCFRLVLYLLAISVC